MSLWLDAARLAAGVNVLLLLGLASVWWRSYRQTGASHTLGLLVVAGFLLFENLLWEWLYLFHDPFFGWYVDVDPTIQMGIFSLCAVETLALLVLARISWI
jgi:hypothetical protein